ncbi:MAG: IS30 family transposase, partial [Proteobacteria bacterium]|nr:IS30 family transposase [Pseudomonadota bacterium]
MNYRHLTLEQRYQIAALRRAGFSQKDCAREIGCHPSTVSRELRRNGKGTAYAGAAAHGHAGRRRRAASSRAHLPEAVRLELIVRLKQEHSPDQIRGRLKLLKGGVVSHTTVYRYARQLGLRHHLRHPKRRRGYGQLCPGRFADRRSIHTRPAIVAARGRQGDWEGDTVRPACGTGALVTLVERRSGLLRLGWSPDGTAEEVAMSILDRLGRIQRFVHTLTFDRGSEFAEDRLLEDHLKAQVYFADPHSPWQRGCNENCNGLLRQYFPRKRDFSTITA